MTNNRRDFEIARDQHWCRIPVRHALSSATETAVLAFYFTRAFGEVDVAPETVAATENLGVAINRS